MKIFLGAFFIFLYFTTSANSDEADSLKRVMRLGSLSEKSRFEVLKGLTYVIIKYRGSLDSALKYGYEAMAVVEEIENYHQIADASKLIGSVYYWQNNYKEALDYFQQALRINLAINNTQALPACYNNLGLVYNHLGYYEEALKNHLNQLTYNELLHNMNGVAITNRHIGNVYNNMDEN